MSVSLFRIEELQKLASEVKQHHHKVRHAIHATNKYKQVFWWECQADGQIPPEEEIEQEVIGRCLWYAHIANVTAWNVQYKENVPISFEPGLTYDSTIPAFVKPASKVAEDLKHLRYNLYTNAGTIFLSDDYLEVLNSLIDTLEHQRY